MKLKTISITVGLEYAYPIRVGSGVWIGDVPADTLVAGVPARVMKEFGDCAAETDQKPGR